MEFYHKPSHGVGQNVLARPGRVYVCLNCGRRSKDLLGRHMLTPGWGPGCARFAVQLPTRDLQLNDVGLVQAVRKGAVLACRNANPALN